MGRPTIPTPPETRAAAVADYRNKLPLKLIAARHGYTPATISIWARAAKIERRPRGIQLSDTPSDRDRAIIRRAREVPINQVAKEFRLTRARIWSIRKKWREAGWVEPLPWKAGDWIEWAGVRFRVLRVDDERRGAVKTESGETVDPFTWRFKGHYSRLAMAGSNWVALN